MNSRLGDSVNLDQDGFSNRKIEKETETTRNKGYNMNY